MWLELAHAAHSTVEHVAVGHIAVGHIAMDAGPGSGGVGAPGLAHLLPAQAAPPPGPPPGQVPADAPAQAPSANIGGKFATLLGDVKWVALAAIIVTFFAGIAVFTAGRVADIRHGAANGTKLMIASGAGAVLYAIGYGVITGLAG